MKTLLVPKSVLLNFSLTLRRYLAFGEDAANVFDGRVFAKAFHHGEMLYLLRLWENEEGICLEILPDPADETVRQTGAHLARRLLGLHEELERFYTFAAGDPMLQELVERFRGTRVTLAPDPFEMLVTSITAQQINLKFAFTVRSRLIRQFGRHFSANGRLYFAFPTPEALAQADISTLREMQFSRRKAEYIIGIARAVASGELDLAAMKDRSDAQITESLTSYRGIGRWTVDWFLARHLGRGHVFPAGDLGVRKAVEKFYFEGRKQPPERLREFAAQWGEFTNLVVHYLLLGTYLTA